MRTSPEQAGHNFFKLGSESLNQVSSKYGHKFYKSEMKHILY